MTSTNSEQTKRTNDLEESEEVERVPANSSPMHSATTKDEPSFGWSAYAERVNGRFAMIGFISILLIEAINHNTFLNWAGIIH